MREYFDEFDEEVSEIESQESSRCCGGNWSRRNSRVK
eukprot:COSAG02_NODE_31610_length_530_cov_1.533643_2_plen_36_part_01